jgi:hypothetical protein
MKNVIAFVLALRISPDVEVDLELLIEKALRNSSQIKQKTIRKEKSEYKILNKTEAEQIEQEYGTDEETPILSKHMGIKQVYKLCQALTLSKIDLTQRIRWKDVLPQSFINKYSLKLITSYFHRMKILVCLFQFLLIF